MGPRMRPAEMTVASIGGHQNPYVDDYRTVSVNPLFINHSEGDFFGLMVFSGGRFLRFFLSIYLKSHRVDKPKKDACRLKSENFGCKPFKNRQATIVALLIFHDFRAKFSDLQHDMRFELDTYWSRREIALGGNNEDVRIVYARPSFEEAQDGGGLTWALLHRGSLC